MGLGLEAPHEIGQHLEHRATRDRPAAPEDLAQEREHPKRDGQVGPRVVVAQRVEDPVVRMLPARLGHVCDLA